MLHTDCVPDPVLTLLRHDYPSLAPVDTIAGIPLLSVADVTAMKINAVIIRGSKRDFFDLHCPLQDFELAQLLDWFESKYPQSNRFLALKSLTWFEDAESEADPVLSLIHI